MNWRGALLVYILLLCVSFVSAESLEVNSLLVKISAHTDETFERTVTLSSVSGGTFSVALEGIVAGITLAEDSFTLEAGESKALLLSFDTTSLEPGVFVGQLVFSGETTHVTVPIILEVETQDVFFDLNLDIPPQYTEVHPGEKVIAQVKIVDLVSGGTSAGLGAQNVLLDYSVVNMAGQQISAESETIAVEGSAQVTQSLSFPHDMAPGSYVFYATVKYQSSVGTSSHLFKITAPSPSSLFSFLQGKDSQTYLIVGVFAALFIGIIAFFMYLLRDRDSLILELHQLNSKDYHRQRSFIQAQARVLAHKKRKSVASVVKHQLARLAIHHKARVAHLRTLKQKGDVTGMKHQLARWKQEYTAGTRLTKLHGLSPTEMKATLAHWKRDYTH